MKSSDALEKNPGGFPLSLLQLQGLSFNFISDSIQNNKNVSKFTDTMDYPFNELFVWAVLMGRQRMAWTMWAVT